MDQETQILGEKMSSRGKIIYAKSEEEALSQYKKDYPKGNARIKESKYPEHIKRAQELNKKQVDERKKKITVGNNPPTSKEQAYMNYKAIKISKYMPKEKQEELKRLKAKYRKEWKG